MTDFNVRTQETASDCLVCGNVLASPDAACSRCGAKPATASAADLSSPEAVPKEDFPDRLYKKPTPVNSPYPSESKPATSTFASRSLSSRRIKFAGAALITLTALIAGAAYLYDGSAPNNSEVKAGSGPIAENGLVVAAQPGSINAPVTAKNTSIDAMRTVDAVQSAMVRGELNTARQQLAMLPPGADQRADVRRINNELVQRERARDSALGLARACEQAGDVPCVLRSAGDALASDISDSEARVMLLRAVTQSGANQVMAVKVNQVGDSPIATHRQAHEKHKLRRGPQIVANNNDVYGKH
ncbi:hypothetical protein [Burkholderia sp. S171]|uniref:hypothetical protein n=1 Tax=Burkholderia sp. S171 TaxID=1641860 RepID=UPI00131BACDA|nr:hypothetical protein [Burkholderia sp. S171]